MPLRHALLVTFLLLAPTTAPTWQLGPFTRPPNPQPILRPNPASLFTDPMLKTEVHWQALHTFNPAAIVRQGKVMVLYRAEDDSGQMGIGLHTSRLGLAESSDGLRFTALPAPVFYPAPDAQQAREQPGGVEDPRLVEREDGTYVLTYTQWNRETYSVGIATSPDLVHWTKHGPAFGTTGPYGALKYKSAGILTTLHDGHFIATKLNGLYQMYWGEGSVSLATSPDLIHWTPVESSPGIPVALLTPRPGLFDSGLPEVGPPPVLTPAGIVLLYNGKNAAGGPTTAVGAPSQSASPIEVGSQAQRDPNLAPGTYSVGQALFSPADPTKLLARTDHPIFYPTQPFERSGQYAAGTTFAEGLVLFHNRLFLYYGCADSFVAVATAPNPQHP